MPRDVQDRIHIRNLPVQVHGHHGLDRLARPPAQRPTGLRIRRAALQVIRQRLRAHAVRAFVDIDELCLGAGLADRFHGRDEGVRDGHDRVAAPYARRHQCEPHGVGTVGHADAVFRAAVGRELPLEAFDLRAADEGGRPEGFTKRGDELFLELAMRCDQIEKWDRLQSHRVPWASFDKA